MCVWNNDTWQWWLDHGFDGIGAGVIGGLVTWLAVRATIRHENRQRDRAADDAVTESIRTHVLDLGRSLRELRRVPEKDPGALQDALFDLQDSAWTVIFVADRYPKLRDEVKNFVLSIGGVIDADGDLNLSLLSELRTELWGRCMAWLADPDSHARFPEVDWAKKVADARADG